MAVQDSTFTQINKPRYKASIISWLALLTGNTGTPNERPYFSDRSVQVVGTFGGSTCVIEGSNDGVNWVTLSDPAGVALSFTVAGLKQILQVTRYIRPNVSGGAGVSLNVYLLIVGD
jgi:hypothetical protein